MASLEELGQNEPRNVGLDRRDGRDLAYTLVGRLRSGRLGNVYLGRRPDGERVEITLVDERLAWDAAMLGVLAADIHDLSRIRRHALVARPIDADLKARRPWIATRFVPGPTLREAVRDHGPLDEAASEALLVRLAEAVSHLHSQGQVHRGLDPDDVVLTAGGPVVTGLGAARALDSFEATIPVRADDATSYRPPEVVRGLEAGMPGDVFGLGATVAYAATGHGPFGTGSSTEVMRAVMRGEPELDDVPETLAPLLAGCLEAEPGGRPTPAALLARLPREATVSYPPAMTDAIRAWERQGLGRMAGSRAPALAQAPPSTEHLEPTTPDLAREHTLPGATAPLDATITGTAPLGTAPLDEMALGNVGAVAPTVGAAGPDLPASIAPARPDSPAGTGRWLRIAITTGALVLAAGLGAALAALLIR